jgi:uroporphyrinogen decarboxylase
VLLDGSPEAALAQSRDAVEQTGGRGLIVGAGCVLPVGTSDATLVSVIKSLGGTPRLGFLRPQ